jgi:hypothetical protein
LVVGHGSLIIRHWSVVAMANDATLTDDASMTNDATNDQ